MAQSNLLVETPATCVDLVAVALAHPCASHPLFDVLQTISLNSQRAGSFLRNYDAHASVLRRLLLKAAAIMPEEAVGFILENVRTEFGAGDISARHQLQLVDLALQSGVTRQEFDRFKIRAGIRSFIKAVSQFYFPHGSGGIRVSSYAKPASIGAGSHSTSPRHYRPAIAAGAITATEVLAIEEFKAMQVAFSSLGLQDHIWFDHVTVEADHTEESLALARYFMKSDDDVAAVLHGLNGVLDANVSLYDGLLSALQG
ncbi:MAG TPA: iron-containing redox enzyme family protein [Oculatellaceae cyanobacterium]